jgi:flagellar basal body-associated protein FliL
MKSKLKIIIPVLLLVLGGTYKFALAKPAPKPHKNVEGEVYVLPKEFLLNLKDGRFVKLNVALLLEPGALAHALAEAAGGGHGAAPAPPEGFGALPQEAVVRDIVTNTLTGATGEKLISHEGREKLKTKILKKLKKSTDVHAEEILFTDVTVQ